MDDRSVDALAVLGLATHDIEFFRRIRPHSGSTVVDLVRVTGLDPDELDGHLDRLVAAGVAKRDGEVIRVPAPARILADLVETEAAQLRGVVARLDRLRVSLPAVRGLFEDRGSEAEFPEGELQTGPDIHTTLRSWVGDSTGDLMWLRPDQWRLPQEGDMSTVVREALARGQRSRAIYPARVLEEAPESVFERMDAGEEVRLVTEVPTRMALVEGIGAVIPEEWGVANERRLVLHQPAVMAALGDLFEELWSRAIVVPGGASTDHSRRLLLEQLARGAKDEQMARVLGLSLRTVRRRVADLLHDLGVETRFQAGVEAVRRGWI